MSIADAVATAHGGRIEVASELGTGTTVTVTLPAMVP
jgi:signal transduction histidine kinase